MSKIFNFFEEKQKREDRRERLVMPTKDLADYLNFRKWFRAEEKLKRKKLRGF